MITEQLAVSRYCMVDCCCSTNTLEVHHPVTSHGPSLLWRRAHAQRLQRMIKTKQFHCDKHSQVMQWVESQHSAAWSGHKSKISGWDNLLPKCGEFNCPRWDIASTQLYCEKNPIFQWQDWAVGQEWTKDKLTCLWGCTVSAQQCLNC